METAVLENTELKLLEVQLDALISTCQQLVEENKTLRERQTILMAEREALSEKNTVARTRIEAMIARLKALEAET